MRVMIANNSEVNIGMPWYRWYVHVHGITVLGVEADQRSLGSW